MLSDHGQGDDVDNFHPNRVVVQILLTEVMSQLSQCPLTPEADSLFVGSVHRTVFVDGRVCEMREQIVQSSQVVLVCTEPYQAFFVHVDSERMKAGHCHVETQVELVSTNEQRAADVPLYHRGAIVGQLRQVLEHEDAASARHISGFTDPQQVAPTTVLSLFLFLLGILVHKPGVVIGQVECDRTEVVHAGTVHGAHAFEVAREPVLLGDVRGARVVVDALPRLQPVVV